MFHGVRYLPLSALGLSQIYLNSEKIANIEAWFDPANLMNFEPLPVHDFGNGRFTLTDGHSRAFVAWRHGVNEIPVVYDMDEIVTGETGQMLYREDLIWCKRFGLTYIWDLQDRILSPTEYRERWIMRCDKSYNLLTQTTQTQREIWCLQYPCLHLYGASEDVKTIYFENDQEESLAVLFDPNGDAPCQNC